MGYPSYSKLDPFSYSNPTNPFTFFHFRPYNGKHGGFSACWTEGAADRLHIGYAFRSHKDAFNRKLGCQIARGRCIKGLNEHVDIRRGYVVRKPEGGESAIRTVLRGFVELWQSSETPTMDERLIHAVLAELGKSVVTGEER